jgi:hypothetical protein
MAQVGLVRLAQVAREVAESVLPLGRPSPLETGIRPAPACGHPPQAGTGGKIRLAHGAPDAVPYAATGVSLPRRPSSLPAQRSRRVADPSYGGGCRGGGVDHGR